MFAAKNLPSYSTLGLDPATATQKALAYWTDNVRTAAKFGMWWTERWMQAPTYFTAWAITRTVGATPIMKTAKPAAPVANVIRIADVIEAAAATVAVPAQTAATALEIVEIEATVAAEALPPIVQAFAKQAETVVETLPPVIESVAEAIAPPAEPHDLTRLVGIGPKLAVALAERGVTRFEHIANWTQDDLAEIDKALDLKGRAVRDAWVAQARRFAADS